MPAKLITTDRIRAGCNIIRWRGWMHNPVNIIQHSNNVARAILLMTGDKVLARAGLVHDLHETEYVGDVPTPDKARYMNSLYDEHVYNFDTAIAQEARIPTMLNYSGIGVIRWCHHETLRAADRAAAIVENRFYSARPDPTMTKFDDTVIWHAKMREIYAESFTINHSEEWWELWDMTNA